MTFKFDVDALALKLPIDGTTQSLLSNLKPEMEAFQNYIASTNDIVECGTTIRLLKKWLLTHFSLLEHVPAYQYKCAVVRHLYEAFVSIPLDICTLMFPLMRSTFVIAQAKCYDLMEEDSDRLLPELPEWGDHIGNILLQNKDVL
jgi:hypothetical protein